MVYQSKLALGSEGKVLIDSTNRKSKSASKNNKKKSENTENLKSSKNKRKDGIYADPPSETKREKLVDSSTQTEPTDDAAANNAQKVIDMMTSETAPSEYWEKIAEKRRIALKETLEENMLLKEENEHLKGENTLLEEMLEEAKELAALVQSLTGDKESTEASDSNEADEDKQTEEPQTESNSIFTSLHDEKEEEEEALK